MSYPSREVGAYLSLKENEKKNSILFIYFLDMTVKHAMP